MIYLIRPEAGLEQAVMDYRLEFLANHEKYILGSSNLHHFTSFFAWLSQVKAGEHLKCTEKTTPADTFLAICSEDMRIVGTIQIRHCITESLNKCGGHIGYGVRPSERRKGYGSRMLEIALTYCYSLGLSHVRIDCEKSNQASAKTIEKCGGILEKEFLCTYPGYTQTILQYSVDTSAYADRNTKFILPCRE